MVVFTVDEGRCDLCGLCAVACPAGLVDVSRGTPVPVPTNEEEGDCFVCGHCVAACPTGAFSHEKAPIHQCLPIDDNLRVSAQQVGQLLRSRRSVRHFTAEPVDRQTIAELLDIARYAPSGCNAQPVHWLVIHDTDRVRHISRLVVDGLRRIVAENADSPLAAILQRLLDAWDEGADVVSRGAPHLVLTHAPKTDPLAPSACTIAQTYLEIAASAFGLGACWMGLVDMTANTWPPLCEFLALPQGHVVLASMALGHSEFQFARIPPRNPLRVQWR